MRSSDADMLPNRHPTSASSTQQRSDSYTQSPDSADLNLIIRRLDQLPRNPRVPNDYLSRVARNWPTHRFLGNATQIVYLEQVAFLASLLTNYLRHEPEAISVLDWGCGKGHISYLLGKHGFAVTSADLADSNFDSAFGQPTPILEEQRIRVVPLNDPVTLPFEAASFDCVTSFGVLEHVASDSDSLHEIRRVLRPGGIFYVTFLPTRFSWTQAAARLFGDSYHDRLYTRARVLELAAQSGFEVCAIKWAQLLPKNVIPIWLNSALELIDQSLCRYTPFKHAATNFEVVMKAI